MSIKIQLDEHTVEDYEAIKILKELGFTDEEIQAKYDKQKESDGFTKGYRKAIDDFVKLAKEHDFKYGKKDITKCVIGFIEFFAEKLKEENKIC